MGLGLTRGEGWQGVARWSQGCGGELRLSWSLGVGWRYRVVSKERIQDVVWAVERELTASTGAVTTYGWPVNPVGARVMRIEEMR